MGKNKKNEKKMYVVICKTVIYGAKWCEMGSGLVNTKHELRFEDLSLGRSTFSGHLSRDFLLNT